MVTPQATDVSGSVSVVLGDIWGDPSSGVTPQQLETSSLRGSLIRLTLNTTSSRPLADQAGAPTDAM